MKKYTVKALSTLANVSVRTLHYYDEIDLLKPSSRSESGYRYYEEEDLLKLQQILFFRELELPLEKIKEIITAPDFDLKSTLKSHRKKMMERSKRFKVLIKTIDNTLDKLNHKSTMTEEQLYEGFSSVEEGKRLSKEAEEKWGHPAVDSHEKIKGMNPEEFKRIQKEGEEISKKLASLIDLDPTDPKVQEVISLHYEHIKHFWKPNKEQYLGLGKMYVKDERFKAHYDKYKEGLAQFIYEAIQVFCS